VTGYGAQFAPFYDRLFPSDAGAAAAVERLAALALPGQGVLELGVGTGRIALPLSERVGEVVGVDVSREMLGELERALAERPRPVTPVLGDVRDFDDGRRYGLVLCVLGTLSMVLDAEGQAAALRTLARAAAPGAAVVVETHNPAWVRALHAGAPTTTSFTPYAARDTGLLSHSTLTDDGLWQLGHFFVDDGRVRVASEVSRLTTADEIDAHARAAGLIPEARDADWAGTPATGHEPMVVCVYRQPGVRTR
jgi:SAM-dependent methyltransferase